MTRKVYRIAAENGKHIVSPNRIIVEGDIARIELVADKGATIRYALIDAADSDLVTQGFGQTIGRWYANCSNSSNTQYAVANQLPARKHYRLKVSMHRLIMSFPEAMQVDHVNGNGLDNRRTNLRAVSNSQNSQNTRLSKRNTTGYRNVTFNKSRGLFRASIFSDGKRYNLGYYATAEQASSVAEAARGLFFSHTSDAETLPAQATDLATEVAK